MENGDREGEQLSWDARQIPLRFDRFDLLDRHLRTRKNWAVLVKVWTVYIQDKKDQTETAAFSRRGTAYLQLDDFDDGYKDLKMACKLGSKEACAATTALPKQKVAESDGEQRRINASAPACEAPVASFSVQPSKNRDQFNLGIHAPGSTGIPATNLISRTQLNELLKREFSGREWGAAITYETATPMRLTFSFTVGRDGTVKGVTPVQDPRSRSSEEHALHRRRLRTLIICGNRTACSCCSFCGGNHANGACRRRRSCARNRRGSTKPVQ